MIEMRSSRQFSRLTSRREFARQAACLSGLAFLSRGEEKTKDAQSHVSVTKAAERSAALRTALELLEPPPVKGRDVYLKASFNSPDSFPATTHPETLRLVVKYLRELNCGRILLTERSGMGVTQAVWDKLGITGQSAELGLDLIALDDLPADRWRREELSGSHWRHGVEVPGFIDERACIVQICCLKTHRFGGQFSASLKNSVGLVAKHSHTTASYNYMEELHASADQRLMIAEINQIYRPALIVMDAMQVFVDGGPESGEQASPGVVLASRDRVAIDAAGVALLRHHGAASLWQSAVFELEQIKRAAELKLGAKDGEQVLFRTRDPESKNLAAQLKSILTEPPSEDKK